MLESTDISSSKLGKSISFSIKASESSSIVDKSKSPSKPSNISMLESTDISSSKLGKSISFSVKSSESLPKSSKSKISLRSSVSSTLEERIASPATLRLLSSKS